MLVTREMTTLRVEEVGHLDGIGGDGNGEIEAQRRDGHQDREHGSVD